MSDRGIGARRRVTHVAALLLFVWGCGSEAAPTDPGDGTPPPPANQLPAAAAGADLVVSVGLTVALDGSASSDADSDPITYAWSLTAPTGSTAVLADVSSPTPAFLPDVEGDYVATLIVNDGTGDSAPDEVTVTATDQTSEVTVTAAAGGTVASATGKLSLEVPAGALAADTEISVTALGEGQLPAVIGALPGDVTAYDLRPDGLTFSAPAEVTFEVPSAITATAGSVSMAGALLLSESGGTIEGLGDVVFAQDDADPSSASISGSLSHFSHAILVVSSMEFRIDAPADVEVGTPFDVTFTVDVTGAGLGDVVAATVVDESVQPVAPAEGFDPDFEGSPSVVTVTNSYTCSEAGEGRIRGRMTFDASDDFESSVTVQLGKAVTCVEAPEPLETDWIGNLFKSRRLMPIPGSATEIASGGAVRRINLQTAAVALAEDEGSGDPSEYTNALADGSFLVHTTLGGVIRYVPGAETPLDTALTIFGQPRHISVVSPGVIAIASAFGDLGLIEHAGGRAFTDPYRDLSQYGGPQQPGVNLQAIWAAADAQTFIGAYTEGDGDAAFDDTRAGIIIPLGGTAMEKIPLPGVIDLTLDFDARHQMEIECRDEGSALFLCVFSSGFEGAAFESPSEDKEDDGYLAIFLVDTSAQTASLVVEEIGNARVGGALFPVSSGVTGVAVANQFTGAIDVWHIEGTQVAAAFSVDVGQGCPNPVDLITIAEGALGAMACQVSSFGPDNGILVFRNLHTHGPPAS